jgi:hypothetical protein
MAIDYCCGPLIRTGALSRAVTVCHSPILERFGTLLDLLYDCGCICRVAIPIWEGVSH